MLPIDASFDVSLANRLARYESYNKHLYRPNTYLHKWWARRCGTTFRLMLKHLVEDVDKQNYYAPGGLEGVVILDPMMGGGTTLHEAIRMGANVIGLDIDPIPVLQARASLTPARLSDLESAFDDFLGHLRNELGPLFASRCPVCSQEAPFRFVLYGSEKHCSCGSVLVVDSLTVRRESSGKAWRLCRRCHKVLQDDDIGHSCSEQVHLLVEKNQRYCDKCLEAYREDVDQPFYQRYRPVVVFGRCPNDGPFYTAVGPCDLERISIADQKRDDLFDARRFDIEPGPKSNDLLRRGIDNYLDLYSSRQLLYLRQAAALLPGYDPQVGLYLALLVSTSLEFNSMLSGYKGVAIRRPGAIRHAFSHHAYSFPYWALENNPINPDSGSGTLEKLFHDRVRRARHWARAPIERIINGGPPDVVTIVGELDEGLEVHTVDELQQGSRRLLLRQGSLAELQLPDNCTDFVVTDPPYFDSIQYDDLSDYFRRWLNLLVPEEAQHDIQWRYDVAGAAVAPRPSAGDESSASQYVTNLTSVFAECHRVLRKRRGRLVFTFHHWRPQAWSALTRSLKTAGFCLVNRYVVHSEHPMSVHIANLRAITDDAVLVLAPREAGLDGDWSKLPKIDLTSSETICSDCATLLGWMLGADLDDAAIEALWEATLLPEQTG